MCACGGVTFFILFYLMNWHWEVIISTYNFVIKLPWEKKYSEWYGSLMHSERYHGIMVWLSEQTLLNCHVNKRKNRISIHFEEYNNDKPIGMLSMLENFNLTFNNSLFF